MSDRTERSETGRAAASAVHAHVETVGDVAVLRDER